MKPIVAAILFALFFSAVPARAAGNEILGGAGAYTCGEFGKEYQENPEIEHMFFTWAQGYMSGLNASAGKGNVRDLASRSFGEQETYLREYCAASPLHTYGLAVSNLYTTLRIAKVAAR